MEGGCGNGTPLRRGGRVTHPSPLGLEGSSPAQALGVRPLQVQTPRILRSFLADVIAEEYRFLSLTLWFWGSNSPSSRRSDMCPEVPLMA